MAEAPAKWETDYQRGQAILRRWGRPIGIVGVVGVWVYIGLLFSLAKRPDPSTGHVYAIIQFGRHSPLFAYGTFAQAVIAYVGLATAVIGLCTLGVLRYIYDPGAFRRSMSEPTPKNPADWR
jgi:hypothetical protein